MDKKNEKDKEEKENEEKEKKGQDQVEIEVFKCDHCKFQSVTAEYYFTCTTCCNAKSSFDLCEACYYASKKNRGAHAAHEFNKFENPSYQEASIHLPPPMKGRRDLYDAHKHRHDSVGIAEGAVLFLLCC